MRLAKRSAEDVSVNFGAMHCVVVVKVLGVRTLAVRMLTYVTAGTMCMKAMVVIVQPICLDIKVMLILLNDKLSVANTLIVIIKTVSDVHKLIKLVIKFPLGVIEVVRVVTYNIMLIRVDVRPRVNEVRVNVCRICWGVG